MYSNLDLDEAMRSRRLHCSIESLDMTISNFGSLLMTGLQESHIKTPISLVGAGRKSTNIESAANNTESRDVAEFAGVKNTSSPLTFSLSPSQCSADCQCRCHSMCSIQSPNFLRSVIGRLFIGYRASPWLRQSCSVPECRLQARQLSVTYVFPTWIVQQAVYTSASSYWSKGPELIFKVLNQRENLIFAEIYHPSHNDEPHMLAKMKYAISHKMMSVFDINDSGETDLWVSMTDVYSALTCRLNSDSGQWIVDIGK